MICCSIGSFPRGLHLSIPERQPGCFSLRTREERGEGAPVPHSYLSASTGFARAARVT